MSIKEYHGETFVAFIDLVGFKILMQNHQKAKQALSKFYQTGYSALLNQDRTELLKELDGLFVSDCGIIFPRIKIDNIDNSDHKKYALSSLLRIIESLSKKLIEENLMLKTSIAFGKFEFEERDEFLGISKNMMFGDAYLKAYLDNENGKPRLNPGQCRIIRENIEDELWNFLESSQEKPFNKLKKQRGNNNHLYYYWMVNEPDRISEFNKKYNDAYNLKYKGMLETIKNFSCS